MRAIGLRGLGPPLAVVGALALASAALGHALLIASDPKAGATLSAPPASVLLTFGEAPDPRLSTIRVLDAAGHDQVTGSIQAVEGNRNQLRAMLAPLADGVFTVAWRTVSTVDGHVAAGSFAFGVGIPPPQTAEGAGTTSPSASLTATIARWLLYLGLIALFGAGFLGFAIEPRPARAVVRLAGIGWVVFTVGTLAVVGLQWADAGVGLRTVLSSSIGLGAVERIAVAGAAGLSVAVILLKREAGRWHYALVVTTAAGAMLIDVLNGHAANGKSWLLQVGVQWLHVIGVGVWIGGLAALLLAVRGQPDAEKGRAVRTFSSWAGLALAAVAGTGFLRALSEIQTIGSLFGTGFGIVVILKTFGLGLLALLGATNRFFNVPSAARNLGPLRRVGSAELAIGTAVLAATGLLANLAPPSAAGSAQASQPRPLLAVGSDFGTSVRVRLLVQPGAAGFNDFTATVVDYDTGAAVSATGVQLRFKLVSSSGVGDSTLDLSSTGSGRFAARGGNLSLDGIWQVTATVAGPSGSVEVPLVVSTLIPSEPVDANAAPGAPTIYSVHLPDKSMVQVYLDPGAAGANELHATFFDVAGSEIPIPTATLALTQADGSSSIINPRELEPGHFVGDVTVLAGTLSVDLIGLAPGGDPLHAHLEVEVQP